MITSTCQSGTTSTSSWSCHVGQSFTFFGPTIQIGTHPLAFLPSDGRDHEPPTEQRDQHPGVYWRPGVGTTIRRRVGNSGVKDRSPLTEAGSDSKLGEIISFTYTSSLTWVQVEGNAQLGTWAPHQRFLDQIQDLAKLSEGKEGSRRHWETLLGLIVFVAQLKRRAKVVTQPVSRLGFFDHETDRDHLIKLHPHLLVRLEPWTRLKDWLLLENFQAHQFQSQCWTNASTRVWEF